jgi:hypothetical protein
MHMPQSLTVRTRLSAPVFPNPLPCSVDPHRRCDFNQTVTQASDQVCLIPPHPILSLLADDCGPYHHLTSAAPSPFPCSAVPSLHGRDASARSSTTRPRTTHPTDGAGTAEGVPSRPRNSPVGMRVWLPRCGALACLLAQRGHYSSPPFPVLLGQRRMDKIPSASSPRKSPTVVHLVACLRLRVHA